MKNVLHFFFNNKVIIYLSLAMFLSFSLLGVTLANQPKNKIKKHEIKRTHVVKVSPSVNPTVTLTATPSSAVILKPSQISPPTAAIAVKPNMVFGMGPEADQALRTRLVNEAPVQMLSSWYNSPNDLPWMTMWKHDLVPQSYAKGKILHLITFTDLPEGAVNTSYGPACGREYPVSDRILDDMKQVAQTFAGQGQLYVTLFTEFQTYPCEDNTWVGSENYYKALKDKYRAIKDIFHQYAPNAKVGISWGGWQSRWDDPQKGAGSSLIPYFADILRESDITSFQAMESGTNVEDVRNMTRILGAYGKPVMVSHYRPDSGSQTTFTADMRAMLTDNFLAEARANGLFAISFMGPENLNNDESMYQFVKDAVIKYNSN